LVNLEPLLLVAMRKIIALILVLPFLISFERNSHSSSDDKSKEVINKLLTSIDKIHTLKWTLKVIERIDGKEKHYGSSVKMCTQPRKLYINIKGTEVLWVEGINDGKALIHPSSFPFFNMNLDPLGSLMRDGQHHTIHEMGFSYMGEIIRNFVTLAGENFNDSFKYIGEEDHNNVKCHKILIRNNQFKYLDYKVKKGENMITIARKFKVGEYMILENNKKHDNYKDIKEGDIIKVPNGYAKNVTLYIDKLYYLPIGIKVEDDKGLYEQYEYFYLQYNPKISDEEFTKGYKDYEF
jgi:hypothetical protein